MQVLIPSALRSYTGASRVQASGATTLLGGDLGCLLNIAGRMKRQGIPVRVLRPGADVNIVQALSGG